MAARIVPAFARLRDEHGVGVSLQEGEPLERPGRVQPSFRGADREAADDRLRAGEVECHEPPQQTPAGFRSATTTDSAGHTVEFRTGDQVAGTAPAVSS